MLRVMGNESRKALQRAVELAGGQTELARKVNERLLHADVAPIKQSHVWNWLNREGAQIPGEYGIPIEQAVADKDAKGEVTRHRLCPHVFGRPLRQSGTAKASCA